MKKGISLSIETVIVLILAVAVLVAMLFFFTGVFTGGKRDFDIMNQQRDKCSAYVSANPKCTSDGDSSVDSSLKTELAKACKELKRYVSCTSDTLSLSCVQQCCSGYCVALNNCPGTCRPSSGVCGAGERKDDTKTCSAGEQCCVK